MEPVFVFDDPPRVLVEYSSLDAARQSGESLDVSDTHEAFTATGQVVTVAATKDVFADLEPTKRRDRDRGEPNFAKPGDQHTVPATPSPVPKSGSASTTWKLDGHRSDRKNRLSVTDEQLS